VPEPVFHHTLPNGLTLLAEPMPHVRSATFYALTPAGCAYDPPGKDGLAGIVTELMTRGAGGRDSEAFALALDNLGVDRGESVGLLNTWYYGGTLARSLPAAAELFADLLLRPELPADDLEAAQELALQDLQALDDAPQDRVMLELRKKYYPAPLSADGRGTEAGITSITMDDVHDHYRKYYRPNGTIISVAGNIDWPGLKAQVERLFGGWAAGPEIQAAVRPHKPASAHFEKETSQTQIAAAFRSVPMADPHFYAARGAVSVLSGGMSSRLFTEVREKRGLCYSVFATHDALKDRGAVFAYAGTRNDRAAETLDVMLSEMKKLREGVTDDELERVKAGLKTSLIMQGESTSARAGSIARDWFHLGRVRPFDELRAAIEKLTSHDIAQYLEQYPLTEPVVVTLGPAPLAS
jgi:predicted Zn-dependent peptidase